MTLQEQLHSDLKQAMRARDVVTRETIRMVMAALKNRRIELGEDLNEDEELAILVKSVKSREDSDEQYENAGRMELAEKELAEIKVIRRYLPQPLTEDELRGIVQGIVTAEGLSSKKDLGRIMKAVMADYRGRADGKLVQKLAGEVLS